MSAHWDGVYDATTETDRSWTEPRPQRSLQFIAQAGLDETAPIIDAGGGESLLCAELIALGYKDVTVLDISSKAIARARERSRSELDDSPPPHWIVADVTSWKPPRGYTLWHDRAVFHFMVSAQQQAAYVETLLAATRPGSHLVIATFGPDGPEQCSGLAVRRWSAKDLAQRFADHFDVVDSQRESHVTPWGTSQDFTWLHLVRRSLLL